MKNLPLIFLLAILIGSCASDPKSSSGTSSHIISPTEDSKTETEEIDNSDKAPLVIDSNNTEMLIELEKDKVKQKSEDLLASRPERTVRVSGTIIGGAGMDITLDKLGGKTNMEPIKTTIINEDGYYELDAKTSQEQIFALRTDSGNM
ncbi:MAG: hypothetical protein ACPGLV_10745, partial [Bacteroidia bacterium]